MIIISQRIFQVSSSTSPFAWKALHFPFKTERNAAECLASFGQILFKKKS